MTNLSTVIKETYESMARKLIEVLPEDARDIKTFDYSGPWPFKTKTCEVKDFSYGFLKTIYSAMLCSEEPKIVSPLDTDVEFDLVLQLEEWKLEHQMGDKVIYTDDDERVKRFRTMTRLEHCGLEQRQAGVPVGVTCIQYYLDNSGHSIFRCENAEPGIVAALKEKLVNFSV